MTTVSDMVELTKRQLFGTHRAQYNFVKASFGSGDEHVTFQDDLKGIAPGVIIEIDDEVMFVRQTNPATKVVTIARAWLGTEAAGHDADTPTVVQPRWPAVEIRHQIQNELRSWGAPIFRVTEFDATGAASARIVDLSGAGDYTDILKAQIRKWRNPDSSIPVWKDLRFRRMSPNSDYVNGALVLDHPIYHDTAVSVTLAAPFDFSTFDPETDLVGDVGVPESALDIIPIGVEVRLLAPTEIRRMDMGVQGEPRAAAEVPPGAIAASARALLALREQRLMEEAVRLRHLYPWRMATR